MPSSNNETSEGSQEEIAMLDIKIWNIWKNENRLKLNRFREQIKRRDKVCRICGSDRDLEAHHIIPISESRTTAFLTMNGILLCHKCHKKTDSFGGHSKRVNGQPASGSLRVIYKTIPNNFQEYPTVGNYSWTENGVLVIFVSDMKNPDYEFVVALHELIESQLCKKRGITNDAINAFDINFEKEREEGKHGPNQEPGFDPGAPYVREHTLATKIEKMVAKELGISWVTYDACVMGL